MNRVMLVDDGDQLAPFLRSNLPDIAWIPSPWGDAFPDGMAALEFLRENANQVDLVLLDMHFDVPQERLLPLRPDASPRTTRRFQGVAILKEIRRSFPFLPVVLLTSMEDLHLGDVSYDLVSESLTYVMDASDVDALRVRIHRALEDARLDSEDGDILWGTHQEMRALRRKLSMRAKGAVPLILEGETGTGKSFLAERFIHAHSGRSGPFVAVDLSTVPEGLVAAHLFGALRGAYTGAVENRSGVFAAADGGTLFIDEIQNAPLDVQKQLLWVLQERKVRPVGAVRAVPVDVKVVAASNEPLEQAVAQGRFRADLYMRLSPATKVRIPPLRERLDDVPFLMRRFAAKMAQDGDMHALLEGLAQATGAAAFAGIALGADRDQVSRDDAVVHLVIPPPAYRMLMEHRWPGNVRELETVVYNMVAFTLMEAVEAAQRGVVFTPNRLQVDTAQVAALLSGVPRGGPGNDATAAAGAETAEDEVVVRIRPGDSLNAVSRDVERQYLCALYARLGGDLGAVARAVLGDASRKRAVRMRLQQLGVRMRDLRGP